MIRYEFLHAAMGKIQNLICHPLYKFFLATQAQMVLPKCTGRAGKSEPVIESIIPDDEASALLEMAIVDGLDPKQFLV